jgi:hypothetical protein
MNLMREQHFRRNCAQHTISVASALFGECRTEGKPELAELCDRIVSTPEWSVARWDTVTAFLHNRRLQRAAHCRRGQPS